MTLKSLPGGEDWLLAPAHAGLCKFESLKDGTVGLEDIALLNDSLQVRADNQRLIRESIERKHGR